MLLRIHPLFRLFSVFPLPCLFALLSFSKRRIQQPHRAVNQSGWNNPYNDRASSPPLFPSGFHFPSRQTALHRCSAEAYIFSLQAPAPGSSPVLPASCSVQIKDCLLILYSISFIPQISTICSISSFFVRSDRLL